jgi:hypothetical protein
MKRIAPPLAAFAVLLAGCNADTPLQTEHHQMHAGSLSMADLVKSTDPQTLDALRKLTAPFQVIDNATGAGYNLFIATPLTAPDGCISDRTVGGMGYHYTRGNNLADDSVALLDPEFIVYAPKKGDFKPGDQRRRLAAFDYFIPYSTKWPGPDDPTFKRAPTLADFSTMRALPNVTFAPSRFGGWMFHIWLWENNPGGIFTNWNTIVPLCEGSSF